MLGSQFGKEGRGGELNLTQGLNGRDCCFHSPCAPELSHGPKSLGCQVTCYVSPSEGIALEGMLSGSYRELLQSFPLISKYFIFFLAKKPEQELRIGEGLPEVLVTPVSAETCKKIPHRWRICKSSGSLCVGQAAFPRVLGLVVVLKVFTAMKAGENQAPCCIWCLPCAAFSSFTEWGEGFAVLALACWTGGVAGAAPWSLPCGRCWLGWATRDALC